jgi:Brp/Blh family beta-carotene 15,15'-monooxygenase
MRLLFRTAESRPQALMKIIVENKTLASVRCSRDGRLKSSLSMRSSSHRRPAAWFHPMISTRASVRVLRIFGVAAFGLAFLTEALRSSLIDAFAGLPFVLGLLTIGMWHGALDSADLARRSRLSAKLRGFAAYLLLMLVVACMLYAASKLVISLFLVLTLIHFGEEDVDFLRRWTTRGNDVDLSRSRWTKVAVAARGAIVVGLPLAFHPAASADFFRRVQQLIGVTPGPFPWEHNAFRFALGLLACLMTAAVAAIIWNQTRLFRRWVGETILLVVAAWSFHPEFFVGLYLLAWHAIRHLLVRRSFSDQDQAAQDPAEKRERPRGTVVTPWLWSLLFFVPAVVTVCVVGWLRTESVAEWMVENEPVRGAPLLATLSAATVAAYIVVTLPHHLLEHGWFDSFGSPTSAAKVPGVAGNPSQRSNDGRVTGR